MATSLSRLGSVRAAWTHLWSAFHHLGHYFGHVAHNGDDDGGVNHVGGGDSDKVYGDDGAYDEDHA